jgi:hypothetical protein
MQVVQRAAASHCDTRACVSSVAQLQLQPRHRNRNRDLPLAWNHTPFTSTEQRADGDVVTGQKSRTAVLCPLRRPAKPAAPSDRVKSVTSYPCVSSLIASRISRRRLARRRSASLVKAPCFSAFRLPFGAPDPFAPPCMRHRFFPLTAGARQGAPERVLAPQRVLANMGAVFR